MYDSFNRNIHYLRVSVTDRCNMRCTYCMPMEGIKLLKHSEILSFEEIADVVKTAVGLEIDKVRITGGEPLVRSGITGLVKLLAEIPGIRDLAMTTNGLLLKEFAQDLFEAGLKRINISLDTMDPLRFKTTTRLGELNRVIEGIEAARKAGMHPIKINCVIENSPDEPDARAVAEFCNKNGLEIRFIRKMNLHNGIFYTVDGGTGGDCAICNRLRLTANGKIKPCLFDDLEYDVRTLGAEKALRLAIKTKPPCGTMSHKGDFYNIGG